MIRRAIRKRLAFVGALVLAMTTGACFWIGGPKGEAGKKPQQRHVAPAIPLPKPPALIAGAAKKSEDCVSCHAEMGDKFAKDAHNADNFSCVVCHGESKAHVAQETEDAKPDREWRHWTDDAGGGWVWRGEKATLQIALLCASCHGQQKPESNGAKQIDWGRYQKTKHGQGVQKGNKDAPACTDCHAAHGVSSKPWTDDEVVELCAGCHGDAAMMRRAGLDPNVVADFKAGTHEEMPDVPPEKKSSCVKCHRPH